MAVPKTIDLFAGLRSKEVKLSKLRGGGQGFKSFVEIIAPAFHVNVDEREIAGAFAKGLTTILQNALLTGTAGRTPEAATLDRRRYREKQSARGGQIDPRIKDKTDRARGIKSWKQRFRSVRGTKADPANPPARGVWGVDSGLLVRSLRAFNEGGGSTWRIFAADNRGLKDRSAMSALDRVFGGMNLHSLFKRGGVDRLTQETISALVLKRGVGALKSLLQAGQRLRSLGRSVENLGEESNNE